MNIDLPSQEEMIQIEASIPVKIPDLAPGYFEGCIEEVQLLTDEHGNVKESVLPLAVRIIKTDNPEHIGKLMLYYLNVRTKQGRVNPAAYKFITELVPDVTKGGGLDPQSLVLNVFAAMVSYNGNYWNFNEVKFIEKREGYGF